MFLGVQIVSVCVMFCVFINFLQERKLPILSTRWYMVFLCIAIANFLFEMFSLLTIYEILPAEWNTISHMLFYFSLVTVLQSFFIFVDIRCRNERRYTKLEIFSRLIPFIITAGVFIFGEIEYHIDGNIRYSEGSMVDGIYVIAAMFMVTYFVLVYYLRLVLLVCHKLFHLYLQRRQRNQCLEQLKQDLHRLGMLSMCYLQPRCFESIAKRYSI